jgi:hypothetical protein
LKRIHLYQLFNELLGLGPRNTGIIGSYAYPVARPPQCERPDDLTRDVTAVKAAIKRLTPENRATPLAWLALYSDDRGELFSPQITKRRDRVTVGGRQFWLVKIPRT